MNKTLEHKVEQGKFEWIGPDFTNNCYCNARYRASKNTVQLGDVEVPVRVEVLNREGNWQRHPVVFIHYGSYEARKNGNGTLVMFLRDGKWTSSPYRPLDDRIYRRAEKLGLTEGNQLEVQSIVKQEE